MWARRSPRSARPAPCPRRAAIADQASPVIVLVRVGVDAQDQDT
jgi:hypothetical protein